MEENLVFSVDVHDDYISYSTMREFGAELPFPINIQCLSPEDIFGIGVFGNIKEDGLIIFAQTQNRLSWSQRRTVLEYFLYLITLNITLNDAIEAYGLVFVLFPLIITIVYTLIIHAEISIIGTTAFFRIYFTVSMCLLSLYLCGLYVPTFGVLSALIFFAHIILKSIQLHEQDEDVNGGKGVLPDWPLSVYYTVDNLPKLLELKGRISNIPAWSSKLKRNVCDNIIKEYALMVILPATIYNHSFLRDYFIRYCSYLDFICMVVIAIRYFYMVEKCDTIYTSGYFQSFQYIDVVCHGLLLFKINTKIKMISDGFASLTRCFFTLKRSMLADIVPSLLDGFERSPSQVPYKAVAEKLTYDSEDIIFPVDPLLRLPSEILRNESCQTIRSKSIIQQPVIVLPSTPLLKQRYPTRIRTPARL